MSYIEYMNFKELFSNIIDDEQIIVHPEEMTDYETDESRMRFEHALCVVKPDSAHQISSIMKICDREHIIVIPRGLGTGLSGGAIPIKPSVIMSLERMNRIMEIDEENLMVTVQPGVITGRLQEAVESKGLFYPPDPASLETCSIGGNIAESSGGPRAVKYGTTRDYVRGLELVTAQGDIMHFGGKIKKDATGYNIKDLIIGSEGTLGIVTEITFSLLPKPLYNTDLLVPFDSMDDAARTVSDIIKAKIIPSTIEFMEERALEAAYRLLGNNMTVREGKAHLLIRIDGNYNDIIERDSEQIGALCMSNNARDVYVASNRTFKENLWKARRSLHDAVVEMSLEMEREDVVVPPSKLPALIGRIKELEEQYGIMIIVFGHAGDGNVHINILKTSENKAAYDEHLTTLVEEILKTAVGLGGKLSGEHGIGIFKKQYMHLVFSEEQISLMKRIKSAFDPNNILNPYKVIP